MSASNAIALGDTLYHVSPASNRASIASCGLRISDDRTGMGAIFLTTRIPVPVTGMDIWAVNIQGLLLDADTTAEHPRGEHWFAAHSDIEPARLQCREVTVDLLREAQAAAFAVRDLPGRMALRSLLDAALIADCSAAFARGFLPVFCDTDRSLFRVVHPSTRQPGHIQVTTYTKAGAIGDTTLPSLQKLPWEINYARALRIPDEEVMPLLNQLGAIESSYQESLRSRRGQLAPNPDVRNSPSP